MIIKPSANLRNDYNSISNLAHETGEPIYITKNGEGDGVFMSIDSFEEREKMLLIRAKVLQAELERLHGEKGYSEDEVSMILESKLNAL